MVGKIFSKACSTSMRLSYNPMMPKSKKKSFCDAPEGGSYRENFLRNDLETLKPSIGMKKIFSINLT